MTRTTVEVRQTEVDVPRLVPIIEMEDEDEEYHTAAKFDSFQDAERQGTSARSEGSYARTEALRLSAQNRQSKESKASRIKLSEVRTEVANAIQQLEPEEVVNILHFYKLLVEEHYVYPKVPTPQCVFLALLWEAAAGKVYVENWQETVIISLQAP